MKGTVIDKVWKVLSFSPKYFYYTLQLHNSKEKVTLGLSRNVVELNKGDIIEFDIKKIGDKN